MMYNLLVLVTASHLEWTTCASVELDTLRLENMISISDVP